MNPHVFALFQKLIYERSGIALGDNKVALLKARVGKRMRVLGMQSHHAYYRHIVDDTTGGELTHLLDAISTNVTGFFREADHFGVLADVFEEWQRAGQTRFRLWSAACSTGEEPYSMAMVLREHRVKASVDVRILATDISTRVLAQCRQGTYPATRMESLSPIRQRCFFHPVQSSEGKTVYQVSDELKQMILFKQLNLTQHPFPMSGPLDVIFCRNVMIYFDAQLRRALVNEMERLLKPGGYLFVGHSESMSGRQGSLIPVQPSVYRKA